MKVLWKKQTPRWRAIITVIMTITQQQSQVDG